MMPRDSIINSYWSFQGMESWINHPIVSGLLAVFAYLLYDKSFVYLQSLKLLATGILFSY